MRLSDHEVDVIRRVVTQVFGSGSRVWLFGSRADGGKSGRDIDLYIETPLTEGIVAAKLDALRDLGQSLGDQRFDLVVRRQADQMSAFHRYVRDEGVPL